MAKQELEQVERTYRRIGRRWVWNAVSFAGFQGWESALRQRAVEHLALRQGDAVLDVACGRGSNFPYLQRAVGPEGRIVGVDYSLQMLAGAEELVRRKGWQNVELVKADAAAMDYKGEFDAALCTNAMSVIPRWQEALHRMTAAVRPGKRVVVMDGRRGGGLIGPLANAYARLFASVVAADLHRDIAGECRTLLADAREERRLFGTYFIVSGRTPGAAERS